MTNINKKEIIFKIYNAFKSKRIDELYIPKEEYKKLLKTYRSIQKESKYSEFHSFALNEVLKGKEKSNFNDLVLSGLENGNLNISDLSLFESLVLNVLDSFIQNIKIKPLISSPMKDFFYNSPGVQLDNWLILQLHSYAIENSLPIWKTVINDLFKDNTYQKFHTKWEFKEIYDVHSSQIDGFLSGTIKVSNSDLVKKLDNRRSSILKKLKIHNLPTY